MSSTKPIWLRFWLKAAHEYGRKDGYVTRQDFLNESSKSTRFALFTPLEIDVLFHFASLNSRKSDKICLDDFKSVFDPTWQERMDIWHRNELAKVEAAKNAFVSPKSFLREVFESAYNFALGSVAGAFGATRCLPHRFGQDQNAEPAFQSSWPRASLQNSIDCFKRLFLEKA